MKARSVGRQMWDEACEETDKGLNWIDATDEKPGGVWNKMFPHLSECVLVANSCSVSIAFYNREDGTWYRREPSKKEWIDKITHWMPLPLNPHE